MGNASKIYTNLQGEVQIMDTINKVFNLSYEKSQVIEDVKTAKNAFLTNNKHFYEKLPYELMDSFDESLLYIAQAVAKKAFSLGFSMATKLTAESFVKLEKPKD